MEREKTMSVKDIFKELGQLEAMLQESFGEITPEIEKKTKRLEGDVAGVIEWAIPKIKEYEAMIAAKKDYSAELLKSAKTFDNKVDNLKGLVASLMNATDQEKIETAKGTASFRNTAPLVVDDEKVIPKKFFTKKIVVSLDRKALWAAVKIGKVKGASLGTKQSIQLKG